MTGVFSSPTSFSVPASEKIWPLSNSYLLREENVVIIYIYIVFLELEEFEIYCG